MARDRRRRRQGFDPLASLFESRLADATSDDVADPLVDEESTLTSLPPAIEMTDPVFRSPAVAARVPTALADDESTVELDACTVELPDNEDGKPTSVDALTPEALTSAQAMQIPEGALADRAVRPRSARDVLTEMRAKAAVNARTRPRETEPDANHAEVERVVRVVFAALPQIEVGRCRVESDRAGLLRAFRADHERFAAAGQIDAALNAGRLIEALDSQAASPVASALVRTDGGEWWVWVELEPETVLACFADPGRHFDLG